MFTLIITFVADPQIVKIIHGSQNDILWLQRDFSLYVINCFDTHVAAKFLKFPLTASYANLVKYYCGGKQFNFFTRLLSIQK